MRRDAPTHVIASMMLAHFDPPAGPARAREVHVLLTLHPTFGRWMQLGGYLEPDDATLGAAALREALEESGQRPSQLGPPALLGAGAFDHVPCGPHPDGSIHIDVRYLAVTDDRALTRSSESLDLAWWPLSDLPSPHDADLALLAGQARRALAGTPRQRRAAAH